MENLHKLKMRASVSENTLFCTCAAHANFLPASVFHLHRENRQKEEKIARKNDSGEDFGHYRQVYYGRETKARFVCGFCRSELGPNKCGISKRVCKVQK